MNDDRDQRKGDHDWQQWSYGAIGLAGLLYGTALLNSVARRQLGDERLELLPHGRGYVRRLQALGNVAPHGDRRRAIAATQDRVFHADLHGSNLRERNPLTRRTHQGEIGNLARIEACVSGRASDDLHGTDVFTDVGDGDAAQEELKLLAHVAGRQADALEPVLIERKTQRGHAFAPIAVDRSHQGTRLHHGKCLRRNVTKLVRVRTHHTEPHGEGRIRAEHQLGHSYAGLRRQAIGHRLS